MYEINPAELNVVSSDLDTWLEKFQKVGQDPVGIEEQLAALDFIISSCQALLKRVDKLPLKSETDEVELPPEQAQYFHYMESRRKLYDAYHQAMKSNQTRRADDLADEYMRNYQVIDPEHDKLFSNEFPQSRQEFLETISRADGQVIVLPVLLDNAPIAITVKRFSPNEEDFQDYFLQRMALSMRTEGIKAQFMIDVVWLGMNQKRQQTLRTIGRSDFYVKQEPDDSIVAYGGQTQDILARKLSKSGEVPDRSSVTTSADSSLRVDEQELSAAGRKGLGAALYSLGRFLASEEGAHTRVVESDATVRDGPNGTQTSYYVDKLGARLETQQIPIRNRQGFKPKQVPVFDTAETESQPYLFGYWFPK